MHFDKDGNVKKGKNMKKLLLVLLIAPPAIIALLAVALAWYNAIAGMSDNILDAWVATYMVVIVTWMLALAVIVIKLLLSKL